MAEGQPGASRRWDQIYGQMLADMRRKQDEEGQMAKAVREMGCLSALIFFSTLIAIKEVAFSFLSPGWHIVEAVLYPLVSTIYYKQIHYCLIEDLHCS